MSLSEFQRRKTTLSFYLFDANKDGIVEKGDIAHLGTLLMNASGTTTASPAQKDLGAVFEAMWASYWAPADRDRSGKVTIDEYLKAQEWVQANTKYDDHEKLVGSMFSAIDHNRDKKIDLKEYSTFVGGLGVAASQAAEAFKRMDVDGDGFISVSEWAKLMWGYYRSDDKGDPGNWIFGSY